MAGGEGSEGGHIGSCVFCGRVQRPCNAGPVLLQFRTVTRLGPSSSPRHSHGDYFAAGRGGIGAVGTMMCAYGVPFHITHGPPLCGSVGSDSRSFVSEESTMMCAGVTTHWLVAEAAVA